MASSIATRWRDLSGEKYWADILEPKVDVDLRRYVIHYGERAGAAGDLFNGTVASRGYGFPLCPPHEFFPKAALVKGNPYHYDVTNYFYTASDPDHSNWFGYVAVATNDGKAALGRRDILVAWRGTETQPEWFDNAMFFPTSAKELFGNDQVLVHSGFLSIYTGKASNSLYNRTSARDQVVKEVRKQLEAYKNEEISITVVGHSLGAALAVLNAADIVANGFNKPTNNPAGKGCMVTAFAYGGPRVGNQEFKQLIDELNDVRVLRITNSQDIVPKLPMLFGYSHVGQKLEVDSTKSPFLKKNVNTHNLEIHLHAVAGVQEDGGFNLEVDRDLALINKKVDALLDENKIPTQWWNHEMFKNMVQLDNGRWKFDDSAYVPYPPTD